MTMWELAVCVDGVNRANSPEQKLEAPTDDEFEQMLASYDHLRAPVQ
jgi:hypothetical protein